MPNRGRLQKTIKLSAWALTAVAIAQELRKPSAERTWHGRVAGFIPYDFRPPTIARMRASWWDPDADHILSEQVFGLGWTLNVGRIARLLRD
jgi:hypothetical protein